MTTREPYHQRIQRLRHAANIATWRVTQCETQLLEASRLLREAKDNEYEAQRALSRALCEEPLPA